MVTGGLYEIKEGFCFIKVRLGLPTCGSLTKGEKRERQWMKKEKKYQKVKGCKGVGEVGETCSAPTSETGCAPESLHFYLYFKMETRHGGSHL